jgi:hypothetical protein
VDGIVRITQLDGKLPNLALMRLAAWHRGRGEEIRFSRSPYRGLDEPNYSRVYGSAIFDFSADRVARMRADFPNAIVGGTWTKADRVTVEQIVGGPADDCDYSIYPEFTASLGFTQRGCRFNCAFCDVPAKEGKPRETGSIAAIWRGDPWPRHIHLLDNDFFGVAKSVWKARLSEARDEKFKLCFNQGINVRVITEEIAEELATVDYRDDSFENRRIYTAWDNFEDEAIFFRGVERLERAGVRPSHLLVYMLVGFDPAETWCRVLYRFHRMQAMGMRPYPMIYGNKNRGLPLGTANPAIESRRLSLNNFQRWAIRNAKFGVPFHEYNANARGWAPKEQASLFD